MSRCVWFQHGLLHLFELSLEAPCLTLKSLACWKASAKASARACQSASYGNGTRTPKLWRTTKLLVSHNTGSICKSLDIHCGGQKLRGIGHSIDQPFHPFMSRCKAQQWLLHSKDQISGQNEKNNQHTPECHMVDTGSP